MNRGEWKQFVRHHVNEILKASSKSDWSYCSSEENPADIGLEDGWQWNLMATSCGGRGPLG